LQPTVLRAFFAARRELHDLISDAAIPRHRNTPTLRVISKAARTSTRST
jgi:hypothetical protein